MDEKPYLGIDLIDYAKKEKIESIFDIDPSTREEALKEVLDIDEMYSAKAGDRLHGKSMFLFKLAEIYWLIPDHYGTCGGCDSFLHNKKKHIKTMLRKAYAFPSVEKLEEYIEKSMNSMWKKKIDEEQVECALEKAIKKIKEDEKIEELASSTDNIGLENANLDDTLKDEFYNFYYTIDGQDHIPQKGGSSLPFWVSIAVYKRKDVDALLLEIDINGQNIHHSVTKEYESELYGELNKPFKEAGLD